MRRKQDTIEKTQKLVMRGLDPRTYPLRRRDGVGATCQVGPRPTDLIRGARATTVIVGVFYDTADIPSRL